MTKAILYAINLILVIWGLIMCLMNMTQIWNIHWILATAPLYAGPVVLLIVYLINKITGFVLGVLKNEEKYNKTPVSENRTSST